MDAGGLRGEGKRLTEGAREGARRGTMDFGAWFTCEVVDDSGADASNRRRFAG